MSRPLPAHLMPLTDIQLPRDSGCKIRTAGRLLAFDPLLSLGLLVHGSAALLVDLSLVLTEETYVPPLKSLLVLLGDIEATPKASSDLSNLTTSPTLSDLDVIPAFVPSHVLKATLMQHSEDLDLELWSQAARAQSADLWRSVEEERSRRKPREEA